MSSVRLVHAVVICAAVGLAPTSAQSPPVLATLTHVESTVYLDDQLIAVPSRLVVVGDSATIRTAGGRAVVALEGGGALVLNERTLTRVVANGVYHMNRIDVLEGTAVVISGTSAPVVSCRSGARLSAGGIFRFDVQPAGIGGLAKCRFRVYGGAAAVRLLSVTSELKSGQTITLDPTCGDMIPTTTFAPDRIDDFDRWSRQATVSLR